jgi:hypothetical protein
MANGAIRNLVRPIEPKPPSRRHCTDSYSYSYSYSYSDCDTYSYSYANRDIDSNCNTHSSSDINANSYTKLGTGGDDKPCTRIDLYRFDRYVSVDRRQRDPICANTWQ